MQMERSSKKLPRYIGGHHALPLPMQPHVSMYGLEADSAEARHRSEQFEIDRSPVHLPVHNLSDARAIYSK